MTTLLAVACCFVSHENEPCRSILLLRVLLQKTGPTGNSILKYISLGFSCQSRMAIEEAVGKQPRRPFDWCITDKKALLAGFETRGASFQHEAANSKVVYRAGREGVVSAGIYFWHDYPKADRRSLESDWSAATPAVNEKHAFLWRRFLDELSEPGEKVFVIATTQDNLTEFASDEEDFRERFALDGKFIDDLAAALTQVCSDRFSILVFVRSLEEAYAIHAQASFERFIVRFCGPLPLKAPQPMVDLISMINPRQHGGLWARVNFRRFFTLRRSAP